MPLHEGLVPLQYEGCKNPLVLLAMAFPAFANAWLSPSLFGMTPSARASLFEFLSFASVSTDPAYHESTRACAQWLADHLSQLGLKVESHEIQPHPVLVARSPVMPGRPTVLIYGHYDVQPADPIDLWQSDPFKPVSLPGGVIRARGASDNKGQIYAHIEGWRQWLAAHSDPRVNVIFLIEGAEECGGGELDQFLRRQRESLQCDLVMVSDTGMVGPGIPTFTYGLRGIAAMEVIVHGPAEDLHSGIFGGAVMNPATVLCHLLATLHDENWHIQVPGFYDAVRPLEPWERESWQKLPSTDDHWKRWAGVEVLQGEAGFSTLERLWARPTAEINGITAGYQGEGTKTVLPSRASAKLTFRLVPDQKPKTIAQLVEAHLRAHCPPGVRLEIHHGHGGEPFYTNPKAGWLAEAVAVGQEIAPHTSPALIREGGSIPIINELAAITGADVVMAGFCLPDANIHAPNEIITEEAFDLAVSFHQAMMQRVSSRGSNLSRACLSQP